MKYALLGGLFLYWAGKFLITSQVLVLLPDFGTRLHSTTPMLPSLVPGLTLIVSICGEAAYRRISRRWDDGLFSRFMRITLSDAALSIVIYAIGSFG